MDLIEIDVVELQALETLVDRVKNVGSRETRLVWARTHAAVHLGGDHDLIAHDAERLERLTGQGFRAASMVDVRRVQEIHTAIDGRTDDAIHRILAEPADRGPDALRVAEGHRSEADLRNEEAGITELFHAHALNSPSTQAFACSLSIQGDSSRTRRATHASHPVAGAQSVRSRCDGPGWRGRWRVPSFRQGNGSVPRVHRLSITSRPERILAVRAAAGLHRRARGA